MSLLLYVVVALFYSITLVNAANENDCAQDCLPRSCRDWYDLGVRKNCYYPIYPDGKTQTMVYCEMKGTMCDGRGGWTRVGYLNMTHPGADCPTGLAEHKYNNLKHKVCARPHRSGGGCASTTFPTLGLSYYKVCGQVRGYQFNSPDSIISLGRGIDSFYVDGISITHGKNPRKHLWTYVCGLQENRIDVYGCPCNRGYRGGRNVATSFIRNHYYCESALSTSWKRVLYASDPLWDRKNCDGRESTCCTNRKMPWFYRLLEDTIKDDIELRICSDQGYNDEGIPLDIIEIYVQ